MRRFIFVAPCCLCLTFAIPLRGTAQGDNPYPDYVVIGAFAKHGNAVRFTAHASRNNFRAKFQMNPNRNLYYVYVLVTIDHAEAVARALKLRQETKYFDTWVYSGPLGELLPGQVGVPGRDLNPVTGESIGEVPLPGDSGSLSGNRENRETVARAALSQPQAPVSTDTGSAAQPANPAQATMDELPKRASSEALTSGEIEGRDLFFSVYRADNHRLIEGEVDEIDFEKSRKMATYAANTPVKVALPAGKSKQVSFVCQVFGYRKMQREFDPASPADDLYLDESGNLVMPFELVRLQKGDIAIMYNVFFFKDAAVMRPESRYEVNNLLGLLVENPGYRIRIHGHTNGNAAGKIIRMGKPDNFYSLTDTKEGVGSARKLSEERALVIKQYLVSNGISADRMEIKAWGGKKPLFDKNSARAAENVRVEIEILSD